MSKSQTWWAYLLAAFYFYHAQIILNDKVIMLAIVLVQINFEFKKGVGIAIKSQETSS